MIDPVTTRYSDALFNLAKSQGVMENVHKDVQRLASEMDRPAVSAFMTDARISVETRRSKLASLLADMHPLLQNFVNLLFDKRREGVLSNLGAAFHRRLLDEGGAAEGIVESARPLAPDQLASIAAAVGPRIGKELELQNRVVPELIGGVRVIVQSRMLDYSVAGRMEGLRKVMLDAPLPVGQA